MAFVVYFPVMHTYHTIHSIHTILNHMDGIPYASQPANHHQQTATNRSQPPKAVKDALTAARRTSTARVLRGVGGRGGSLYNPIGQCRTVPGILKGSDLPADPKNENGKHVFL